MVAAGGRLRFVRILVLAENSESGEKAGDLDLHSVISAPCSH